MESIGQDILQILRNVLTQLPSLLTLLICLVVAVGRLKHHRKVSLVASLAFVLIILHGLIFSAAYILIPRWLGSGTYDSNAAFFSALAFITNCSFAIVLAILLFAIFIDRGAHWKEPEVSA